MQSTQFSIAGAAAWPLDISVASGGNPDHGHPYDLKWYHGPQTSTQTSAVVGPGTQTWPSVAAQAKIPHGPTWQHRPPYQLVPYHSSLTTQLLLPHLSTAYLFRVVPTRQDCGCLLPTQLRGTGQACPKGFIIPVTQNSRKLIHC